MYAPPRTSPLRFAIAAVTWLVAMALVLLGGVVGGTGRVVLTIVGIVLLVAAVAYVGLQLWWLARLQQRSRPSDRDRGSPPPS
jgi:hypothetical protein